MLPLGEDITRNDLEMFFPEYLDLLARVKLRHTDGSAACLEPEDIARLFESEEEFNRLCSDKILPLLRSPEGPNEPNKVYIQTGYQIMMLYYQGLGEKNKSPTAPSL